MTNQFEFKGINFQVGKLSAFRQFHILRRLGPILSTLVPVFKKIADAKDSDQSVQEMADDKMFELIEPIMTGISSLSDKDADFVLIGLLSCVEVQQGAGWAKLVVGNDQLAFQNFGLDVLLNMAAKSFAVNLSGFFLDAQPSSSGLG